MKPHRKGQLFDPDQIELKYVKAKRRDGGQDAGEASGSMVDLRQ
jgi:hypothetical protein